MLPLQCCLRAGGNQAFAQPVELLRTVLNLAFADAADTHGERTDAVKPVVLIRHNDLRRA